MYALIPVNDNLFASSIAMIASSLTLTERTCSVLTLLQPLPTRIRRRQHIGYQIRRDLVSRYSFSRPPLVRRAYYPQVPEMPFVHCAISRQQHFGVYKGMSADDEICENPLPAP
jgi:hypothetical protein